MSVLAVRALPTRLAIPSLSLSEGMSLLAVQKGIEQPKGKDFGQDIPGTSDPDVGMSLTPALGCPSAFFLLFLDRERPGCPGIRVGTSRDLGAHLGHMEKPLCQNVSG